MPALERSNPLPLYYQLKEVLRQQIQAGHLSPHTAIPSEPELVSRYQVSRATVRQALTELVNEGLLYRQHGKGTFVREQRAQQSNSEVSSLTQELRRRGKRPGGILLLRELVRGDESLRGQLHLAEEDQLFRLERLRTADGQPIAIEVDFLPFPRSNGVYTRADETAEGSLYQLMTSEGLIPAISEQVIKAGSASLHEANLLNIAPGGACVRVAATTFDMVGSPIAYSEITIPADRFDLRYTLRIAK